MTKIHLYVAAACTVVLALAAPSLAGDTDMLQDICVADLVSPIKINGFPCKANVSSDDFVSAYQKKPGKTNDPNGAMVPAANVENFTGVNALGVSNADVSANDFFSPRLRNPGDTNNPNGSNVTAANVENFPGVNTLGVSMARIDYGPGGLNPPHTHPRATEIIFVLEGVLEVGFITTADKLFSKIITKGDVFVFPRGLVHFQQNRGHGPATVIAAFNSQLQGTQAVAMTLFGATPPVPSDILAKAFRINNALVDAIKARF